MQIKEYKPHHKQLHLREQKTSMLHNHIQQTGRKSSDQASYQKEQAEWKTYGRMTYFGFPSASCPVGALQ